MSFIPFFAEIADKMMSLGMLWQIGITLTVIAFVPVIGSRYAYWFSIPFSAFFFLMGYFEHLSDGQWARGVRLETGEAKAQHGFFAFSLPFLTVVLLVFFDLWRWLQAMHHSPARPVEPIG